MVSEMPTLRRMEVRQRLLIAAGSHEPSGQQIPEAHGRVRLKQPIVHAGLVCGVRRFGLRWRGHVSVDEVLEFIGRQYPLRDVSDVTPVCAGNWIKVIERIDILAACKRENRALSRQGLHITVVEYRRLSGGREGLRCIGGERSS